MFGVSWLLWQELPNLQLPCKKYLQVVIAASSPSPFSLDLSLLEFWLLSFVLFVLVAMLYFSQYAGSRWM